MLIQNIPAITQVDLFSYGFLTKYTGSNTSITVGAGVCRDSNNVMDIIIGYPSSIGPTASAPITLDFTKNGVNGLDQGNIAASEIYAIYVIADSSGFNASATLASLDINPIPLMPTGYDSYRLQSYVSTDSSSHIISFIQYGTSTDKKLYYTNAYSVLVGGNATVPTLLSLDGVVPSVNQNILVDITMGISPGVVGDSLNINNVYSVYGQVVSTQNSVFVSNAALGYSGNLPVLQWYVSASSDSALINVNAFTFYI